MNLVILGPQGSGKGTQAQLLVKKFGWLYFSPGEVLRALVKKKTPLARRVDRIMNQEGRLIPDRLMLKIMDDCLGKKDLSRGIVFDGYPRNLSQAKMLADWLAKRDLRIDRVIFLSLSRSESVRRLSSRLECPHCEAVFNLLTKPPRRDQLCDFCGAKLVRRADDQPEAIRKRLAVFEKETRPLVAFYRRQGILTEINGERPIEVIHQEIVRKIIKPRGRKEKKSSCS